MRDPLGSGPLHFRDMARATNPDRVKIWNAFFFDAWQEAKAVHERKNGPSTKQFGTRQLVLDEDQRSVLFLLAYCTLAIEARANHLIDEWFEKGRLRYEESEAAQRLAPNAKWFLLPRLAGSRKRLSSRKRHTKQLLRSVLVGTLWFM